MLDVAVTHHMITFTRSAIALFPGPLYALYENWLTFYPTENGEKGPGTFCHVTCATA
jgi:hypothetical protein